MKLPDKDSQLIRLALADLRAAEQDKRYTIDMTEWHSGDFYGDKCSICLAGAVMAGTLEKSIEILLTPDCFDSDTEDKLRRIDGLRTGLSKRQLKIKITPYKDNKAAFYRDMETFAAYLESKGE